jgi:hypothetical protein
MILTFWFCSTRMAIGAVAVSGVVTDAPPIARRFIGHSVKEIEQWMTLVEDFKKV